MTDDRPALSIPHVQSALLSEAVRHAAVGVLVWDDDRRYVAANPMACELLGCTVEELVGSVVGDHTEQGEETVEQVIRDHGGIGEVTITRFDGAGDVRLAFVSFTTSIAGVPYLGSIVWPATR
jgi:PAS domain S-box-containing protein